LAKLPQQSMSRQQRVIEIRLLNEMSKHIYTFNGPKKHVRL